MPGSVESLLHNYTRSLQNHYISPIVIARCGFIAEKQTSSMNIHEMEMKLVKSNRARLNYFQRAKCSLIDDVASK